jgi:hypothetical protein
LNESIYDEPPDESDCLFMHQWRRYMHPPNFISHNREAIIMLSILNVDWIRDATIVMVESSSPSVAAEFNLFSLDIMKMLFAKITKL